MDLIQTCFRAADPLASDAGLQTDEGKKPRRGKRSAFTLPRLQVFEFHDQPWFPASLRLGTTESLRRLVEIAGLSRVAAPLVRETLVRTHTSEIVNLCSGSCGSLIPLMRELCGTNSNLRATATDLYPNAKVLRQIEVESGGLVRAYLEPVDARRVPVSFQGMRTIFNGFHHFAPDDARAILRSAHDSRVPIGILEITDRSIGRLPGVFPGSLLLALFSALSVKSATVWALTFVLPILPLTFAWDGLISCFRTYTPSELREMTSGMDRSYVWETGERRTPRQGFKMVYLIGRPVA